MPEWLAILSALASVGASAYGGMQSAGANAEARARLEKEASEDRAHYDRLLNRDYVNSSENQSILRRLQELQRDRYNQARRTNVVAGGTDASLASLQQAGDKVVSETAQGIAARSDAYKERVMEARRSAGRSHAQQMFGLDMQKAQNIAQAAGQASKAFGQAASAFGRQQNPYDTSGTTDTSRTSAAYGNLSQAEAEAVAQANIDAQTQADMDAYERELQKTLDDI